MHNGRPRDARPNLAPVRAIVPPSMAVGNPAVWVDRRSAVPPSMATGNPAVRVNGRSTLPASMMVARPASEPTRRPARPATRLTGVAAASACLPSGPRHRARPTVGLRVVRRGGHRRAW